MPTDFISIKGSNYVPDRAGGTILAPATPLIAYRTRFNRPPGMTTATATAITDALGATATTPGEKVACEGSQTFEPRRLKFTFANGGSISVPAPNRAQLITLATQIRGILQTDLGATVVCISLIGEEWKRLDQELRPPGVVPTPGIDIRPAAGSKNPVYTAAILYESDGGRTFAEKVRMNTNITGANGAPNLPFSPYEIVINSALGPTIPRGCGSATNVKPRHYLVDILTNSATNPVRKLIIPVADDDSTDIRDIGIGIATNPQTLCLKYFGESDLTFSRLVP